MTIKSLNSKQLLKEAQFINKRCCLEQNYQSTEDQWCGFTKREFPLNKQSESKINQIFIFQLEKGANVFC